eukprot:3256627-Prorocentrum_lima.AAC.1
MFVTRLVDQKWQERVGGQEPTTPVEQAPSNAEIIRALENLGKRLDHVESNQGEMKILKRMNEELNRRLEAVSYTHLRAHETRRHL